MKKLLMLLLGRGRLIDDTSISLDLCVPPRRACRAVSFERPNDGPEEATLANLEVKRGILVAANGYVYLQGQGHLPSTPKPLTE